MFLSLTLDAQERFYALIGCALLILGATFFMFRHLRRYRLISDTPTALIRSAPQGYVELIGHVCGPGEQGMLRAPLSGRECVWFRYRIERRQKSGKSSHWRQVRSGRSDQWFQMADDTGICLIDPVGAEVNVVQRRIWYGDQELPGHFSLSGSFSPGRRYRYLEELMLEHEPLYALGQFRSLGGGRDFPSLAQRQGEILREWKLNYPALLQRFAEGSETFTPEQWQAVTEAAAVQAQEELQALQNSPTLHLLSDPQQRGRPLLLSTQDEEKLMRYFRWRAAFCLGLIAFALGFGLELWLTPT